MLDGRPTARRRRDAAIFFNFRPGSRAPALAAPPRGGGRPDDDDALPRATSRSRSRSTSRRSPNTLAEVLAANGLRQLHVAETEKYAHVTYFFNGGEESEWEGETRILVPSPRDVPSYDLKPEMSAAEVARAAVRRDRRRLRVRGRELREPGHGRPHGVDPGSRRRGRGDRPRARARSSSASRSLGGVCLVTADHGNAEVMLEPDGVSPHTAHTTNRVPLSSRTSASRCVARASCPTSHPPFWGCSASPFLLT